MKLSNLEGLPKFITLNAKIVEFEQYDYHSVDGVFVRRIHIPKDSFAPQHSHAHSHITLVMGMVMAWKGQKTMGKFKSGEIIEIEANVQHTFLAMEDTDIFCIHNEEHALVVSEGKIGV